MYSSCLFCASELGENRAPPAFSLGSRLAFDAARGRLRVICAVAEPLPAASSARLTAHH